MTISPLERAVALLAAGELVAFPTETVYGLGADAANAAAVAKIFAAKGRPQDHPLIVHLAGADALERWARDIPAAAFELAEAFWPGPLTLILKRRADVHDVITGGQDTIGLRVPGHPLALDLLRAFAGSSAAAHWGGLAAPSANRFGRISPTTAAHVREELGDAVPLILDGGPCAVGIESTILDLSGTAPRLLRPGMIGAATLAGVLGDMPLAPAMTAATPRVSGSLAAHYAPATPLELVPGDSLPIAVRRAIAAGERVAVLSCLAQPLEHELIHWQRAPADPVPFAHELYANLHALDQLGLARILVQQPPPTPAWFAINDRLQRAATGSGKAG